MNTDNHLFENKKNKNLAKYEWEDETGLRHPSLVVIDLTGLDNIYPEKEEYEKLPVLQIRQIYSIGEYFKRGLLNHHKLPHIKGYEFIWYDSSLRNTEYALYLAYKKIEGK